MVPWMTIKMATGLEKLVRGRKAKEIGSVQHRKAKVQEGDLISLPVPKRQL